MSKNPIWLMAAPDPHLAASGFYQIRQKNQEFLEVPLSVHRPHTNRRAGCRPYQVADEAARVPRSVTHASTSTASVTVAFSLMFSLAVFLNRRSRYAASDSDADQEHHDDCGP